MAVGDSVSGSGASAVAALKGLPMEHFVEQMLKRGLPVAQVVSEAKADQERVLKHRTTLRRQRTALEEGARDMQREVEEGLDATKGLTDDDAARTDSVDRVKFGDFCGRYP